MVKPVSLSDKAFAALRKEKREGESDSDVVLRLIQVVEETRKDPLSWIGVQHRRVWTPEEHLRILQEAREYEKQRPDPWERD